jgi:uncharacterized protein (UPF0248 family)
MIMKKFNLSFLLVLLVLCVSCGSDTQKKDNLSTEPNDKIDEANSIEPDVEFDMKIHPKEDQDWYKIIIPGPGYLKLVSKNIPEDLDVQVRFARYDEWGEKKEVFLTNFLTLPAAVAFEEKDTCYALLADRWNENASETPFTLKFEFIEEFDEHEPNNDVEAAKAIELDEGYKSAIFPKKDEDWFKFTTTEQGYIRVMCKENPEDLDLAVLFAVYDEFDGTEVIKNKKALPQSIALPQPGEYYMKLCDRWHEKASEQLFTWKPDFIPEMDTCEPNNEYADAKLIEADDTVKLAIFPKDDLDMFKFIPESPGMLKIKSEKTGDVNVSASIYKLNEDELEELQGLKELPVKYDVVETGMDYYIVIRDRWKEEESPEPFDVMFEYTEGMALIEE